MKKLFFFSILIATLASCGQQKFAFRKKISVKSEEQQIVQRKHNAKQYHIDTQSAATQEVQEPEAVSNAITAGTELALLDVSIQGAEVATKDLVVKPIPQEQKKVTRSTETAGQQKTMGDKSGLAIAGFVLSLVGLLLFPVPCGILAIIFGALSLKSSRRGLAIAALVIGIVDVVLGLAIIASM